MTVGIGDSGDEGIDGLSITDVEHSGHHWSTESLDLTGDVGQQFGLSIAYRQCGAAACEEKGGVATDAFGGAGDDGDSVGQQDGSFVEEMGHGFTLAHPSNARD